MSELGKQAGIFGLFAALMLAFAGKGLLLHPPSPPAVVAPGAFDTARAVQRLERILGDQQPHPVDNPANDRVRARLIAELRALGMSPEVRERMNCNGMPKSRTVSCSLTRNVTASVGPASGRRLLLNAHYDSTPTGPGASDDGIGVAILLEIAAVLQGSPPPRPVTLLFNEGEEYGLNGARAFVESDPLAREVDSLLNVESRGVDGPALMFETSTPNGPALADYRRAAMRPYANSVSTDFATLIPNTTDVTVLKERGWKTLNYSIIGNEARYHSPGDTLDALDRSSLFHLGSEVLAATRTLAGTSVAAAGNDRTVFTDIAGRAFVALPLGVAWAMLASLLTATILLAYRRRALGRPLVAVAGAVLGAVIAAALASEAAAQLRVGDFWRAFPLVAYLAVYATVLAVEAALLSRLARGIDRKRLRSACWLMILIVGGAASVALPGATIFFLFPPLIALVAMLAARWSAGASTVLLWAAALFQLLLFAELLGLIEMLLVDGALWAVAPLAALAALPILIEAPRLIRVAFVSMGLVAIGLWIAALVMPRMSEARPGAFTVDYVRDDVRGKASWTVASKRSPLPHGWDRFGQWRSTTAPLNGRSRWSTTAPLIEVPRPALRLLSSVAEGKGRRVLLAIGRGGGDAVAVKFAKDAPLVAMGLRGRPRLVSSKAEPGPGFLRCTGRACDGLVLEVRLADRKPVKAELIGIRFALPSKGRALAAARPAKSHPQYAPDSSIRIRGVIF